MKEVKHYAVRIHGGPKGSGDGSRASIHLFDKKKRMVGHLSFMDAGVPLTADKISDDVVYLALPSDQLSDVVDMLRYEKPIYVEWQASLKNAYLGTIQEPVGEGERIGFKK
ncbi:MAG: hypothetical protein AB8F95_04780 [Bacteroidia bacterium]